MVPVCWGSLSQLIIPPRDLQSRGPARANQPWADRRLTNRDDNISLLFEKVLSSVLDWMHPVVTGSCDRFASAGINSCDNWQITKPFSARPLWTGSVLVILVMKLWTEQLWQERWNCECAQIVLKVFTSDRCPDSWVSRDSWIWMMWRELCKTIYDVWLREVISNSWVLHADCLYSWCQARMTKSGWLRVMDSVICSPEMNWFRLLLTIPFVIEIRLGWLLRIFWVLPLVLCLHSRCCDCERSSHSHSHSRCCARASSDRLWRRVWGGLRDLGGPQRVPGLRGPLDLSLRVRRRHEPHVPCQAPPEAGREEAFQPGGDQQAAVSARRHENTRKLHFSPDCFTHLGRPTLKVSLLFVTSKFLSTPDASFNFSLKTFFW